MTSKSATISSNGENAYLPGRRASGALPHTPTHSELRMQTEYLHVIPDDDLARTDKPVQHHRRRITLLTADRHRIQQQDPAF